MFHDVKGKKTIKLNYLLKDGFHNIILHTQKWRNFFFPIYFFRSFFAGSICVQEKRFRFYIGQLQEEGNFHIHRIDKYFFMRWRAVMIPIDITVDYRFCSIEENLMGSAIFFL